MIEISNVSKTYPENNLKAVDALNLTVQPGKIFGFLGPNGAGKSTTIKMLTGILAPDEGRILMNGIDISRNPVEAKRIIGYVPDEAVFYEKMSGADFLAFIADIYEMDRDSRRYAFDIAAELSLTDKLAEPVSSYSHGMKQKLSITAALMHRPGIFILDEPMSGLDPQSAFVLKKLMRRLCDEGKTVFFSTHVMEVAEKICDEVAIISRGQLVASGNLENLRKIDRQKTTAGHSDTGASGRTPSLEEIFLELTDENDHTA